jgi:hypothetical protein
MAEKDECIHNQGKMYIVSRAILKIHSRIERAKNIYFYSKHAGKITEFNY